MEVWEQGVDPTWLYVEEGQHETNLAIFDYHLAPLLKD